MLDENAIRQLLLECAQQNQKAMQSLYRLTASKLYGAALRLLQNRDLADEALQEAFVHIWYKASEYDAEKGSPIAWMATIVRYRAVDIIRREASQSNRAQALHHELEIQVEDDFFEDHRAEQNQHLEALQHCLEQLDDNHRRSVLFSYYYGYSHHEVVEKLQRPLGTIKSWIRRGLQSIRECMQL
ncbi:MAG: sigma-70 family RNA polymerase sigma factor [Thiotrichales bacterium]|nr:sigma-70 family RNA polymerase sigma factor [Thiotrichales bacterium]